MSTLKFAKYSGNGNDFIIIDEKDKPSPELIEKLCHRNFGIGADGLLTIGSSSTADVKMRIFNADGGEAEMCGNGLRCLASYFDSLQSSKKDLYKIETMNAVYPVSRKGSSFALEMTEVNADHSFDLSVFKDFQKVSYVYTGVPHLVLLSDDAKKHVIKDVAPFYRFHPMFPKGTNVTIVSVLDSSKQSAYARTYERGVEDETYSCGTGLTATGVALSGWFGWGGEIELFTKGGKQLVDVGSKVFYSGEVFECFRGEVKL